MMKLKTVLGSAEGGTVDSSDDLWILKNSHMALSLKMRIEKSITNHHIKPNKQKKISCCVCAFYE